MLEQHFRKNPEVRRRADGKSCKNHRKTKLNSPPGHVENPYHFHFTSESRVLLCFQRQNGHFRFLKYFLAEMFKNAGTKWPFWSGHQSEAELAESEHELARTLHPRGGAPGAPASTLHPGGSTPGAPASSLHPGGSNPHAPARAPRCPG